MKGIISIAALILLTAMAGCGGDNPIRPAPQPSKYHLSSTPEWVLENLRLAYTTRDSTGYNALFDAGYAGSSIDNSDPTPALITFTKADEAQHIGALARSTSIVSVYLTYGTSQIRYTDASDSAAGWTTIQTTDATLEINDVPTSLSLGSNEIMEFKFIPTTPYPGSQTDTIWHIIRWTEIAN